MGPGESEPGSGQATSELLAQGRQAHRLGDWSRAHACLSSARAAGPLAADDLWALGVCTVMMGRDPEFFQVLEETYDAYLAEDDIERAVRCAFWLGMRSLLIGETSRGGAWLARAQRLLARERLDSVQRGYLLLPNAERLYVQGEYDDAFEAARRAVEIAERFGDRELLALGLHTQGRIRVKQARVPEGLALLDEAMLTASSTELFPPVAGIVYCGLIATCRSVYELRRAQEWTAILSRWCERQRGMVAFAGRCLVHRSEIFQLHGEWQESLEEARKAWDLYTGEDSKAEGSGLAHYQHGEVLRLMGEFEGAEESFRQALANGHEPQPGLALLRLAQGDVGAARAALSRALAENTEPLKRARLLPAYIEVQLAAGALGDAAESCRELSDTAERFGVGVLATLAAQARGATELASGDAEAALVSLRQAWRGWQEFEAPYEIAGVRVLLGAACRALGDEDTAKLELQAACDTFRALGARPDLERSASLLEGRPPGSDHDLSPRELEVLRLLAGGASNKAIATRLDLSERTVHRHVSNIFVKLEVSSRAAATAYAYEHRLV